MFRFVHTSRDAGVHDTRMDQAPATPGQAAHDWLWLAAAMFGAAVIGAAAAGAIWSSGMQRQPGRRGRGLNRSPRNLREAPSANRPLESDEVELKSMMLEGRYTGA